MTRDELVEAAAHAAHQYGLSTGGEHAAWDDPPRFVQDMYTGEAEAVLNRILPQISTVDDLEVLQGETLLVDAEGDELRWHRGHIPEQIAESYAWPLTVVWQP